MQGRRGSAAAQLSVAAPPQRYRGPPLKRASGASATSLGPDAHLSQRRALSPSKRLAQWPAYTAPPPASLSSGPAAQARTTYLFHPAAGESHPTRLRASISSQMTASASRPPNFTFLSLPVRHSEPDLPPDAGERIPGQTNLPFQVPRWRRHPSDTVGIVLRRASARASQLDKLTFPSRGGETYPSGP
ncbi:hypothetical protein G5714_018895 [Onychostoma macrolepis]|uniref:Uncharacterized protein n=1 Tax=Onychostoma macrolepis TaxID=369639 RepID=A0A7J6C094_9TELE|nr:hypothetical protein G5714_018895 [Onychostoma macrolepis]